MLRADFRAALLTGERESEGEDVTFCAALLCLRERSEGEEVAKKCAALFSL